MSKTISPFRVKVEFRVNHKTTTKDGLVNYSYDIKAETEEFQSQEDADRHFNELKSSYDRYNPDKMLLSIKVQKLIDGIIGPFWSDIRISNFHEYIQTKD